MFPRFALERSDGLDRELERAAISSRAARKAVSSWSTLHEGQWGGSGADLDSIFDLGSITKPCVALLAGVLAARSAFSLDDTVGSYFPELSGSSLAATPIRRLLRHESGLPAHRRFYADSWAGRPVAWADVLGRMCRLPRGAPGGIVYSDLGYMLVGRALEAWSKTPLDHLLAAQLLGPLGVELGSARAFGRRETPLFVETEVQPARGGLLRGQVHDDNAWALSGMGTSGHAGLFGTLSGVLGLGRALLDGFAGRGLLASVLPDLLMTPSPTGHSTGFMHPTGPMTSAGSCAGPRTFGHLGFPGTSFWCDPDRGAVTVLLTNRVFPRRSPIPGHKTILELRREHHDFLWGAALCASGGSTETQRIM